MKFLDKYKVLLTAVASALILTLQQFLGAQEVSWKAIGLAAMLSVVGVIGNYLRGQYVSMAGIIGIATMAIEKVASGGVINWQEMALSAAIALLTLVAPPPKTRTYEHDPMIERAKDK